MYKLIISICSTLILSTTYAYQTDSLDFTIEGYATGLNNKKVTLHIPAYPIDNRQITVVRDNYFIFKGKLVDSTIYARILLDEDITNPTGAYTTFPFILSSGKTSISFKATPVKNEGIRYRFSDLAIIEGAPAILFYKYQDLLNKEVFGGLSYRPDSLYLDSMNRIVIPQRRKKFEELFVSFKDSIGYPYVQVKLLENFSKSALYDKDDMYLTPVQKRFILEQFKSIEPNLYRHSEKPFWTSYFSNFVSKDELSFHDFELLSSDQQKLKLSTIVKKNKYTVLYFWWSGCVPCRVFINKERNNYNLLKQKNIEFVSINVDDMKYKWRNASQKDKIPWINLYSGNNSPIIPSYQVEAYPTKIIFNNQLEIIDVSFISLKDLLKLQ
ncbi:MAG: TlpA family protein disulfide reductase [Sediminibacterium sp. Gen4]|jgi:thiol-disulfide isomerase/thioredoxin|uniref:TlpA family protein disulfide reductase n=1 Tax=unclassified Sediminibacterium TaxID=2635961 RepID=UPI0015BA93C9|nr:MULTISPECIES: TlpA disulfide reductase family protein [unclassified Sediminibacterium]MBW0159744.1 TlpA family protein disulfide reductase [Sediminibacterium sp.]MBW0165239.1 TlpA family protein disulfide reductase [Sediminibacterium sp.]NWK65029.1 TlpA family protein disulfide reductase [Sediminibacterium sp. Gen4]